jgi:DedD protein
VEESERSLSITALTLLFLLGVGVCAVFFSLGFLVGYKERSSSNAAEVERVTSPADAPPVVNPPPEKEETSLQHAVTPVPAVQTVQSPTTDSGQRSQPRPNGPVPAAPREVSGGRASATSASGQDAGSGAAPAAATAGNPSSSEAPGRFPTKQPETAGIVLQVAALQSMEDAGRLVKVLKERGYPVFLVNPKDAQASDNLFRVQVGPFALRDEAEKTRQKLVTEGFKPFIKR